MPERIINRHVKCPGLVELHKRFALSPDEASEIIAIWGMAAEPAVGVKTELQDFLTGQLRQQCPRLALALRLFKALH